MRTNIPWATTEASTDGGFEKLPAGPYVAKIVDMVDNDSRQYVELVFDIAEGEHANFYGDKWGKEHPFAHHIFLSYKDTALGMLKGRLQAIQESNPGFDPFAAWDAGRLDMFNGRILGINLQEEEYERNDSDTGTRLTVCQVVPAQYVRDGKIKARDIKKLKGGAASTSTAATPVVEAYNGPIPFN